MTSIFDPSAPREPFPVARALALVALGLFVFALLALRIPLSSEIRYIEAAREMVESGDWTVPHLGYVPYLEKPILLYWLAAASRSIGGDGEIVVRLPSILASTATLWLTFVAAWRLGGVQFATRAAFVLLGSIYFAMLGSSLTTDPLFAFWLWASWCAYWTSLNDVRVVWKWGFWLCLSLGFMTKGPLALILVLGAIGSFHVVDALSMVDVPSEGRVRGWLERLKVRIFQGFRVSWKETRPSIGVVVLLATNLPWTILVYRRDPRLLEFFYVRENFQAFFDGAIHHSENWLYYGGVLAVALVPWTLPGLFAIAQLVRERIATMRGNFRERVIDANTKDSSTPEAQRCTFSTNRQRTFLIVVVAFTLFFLEISSAKLGSYILPIVPPLLVLVVAEWSRALERGSRWMRWIPAANAALIVVGGTVYALVDTKTVSAFVDGLDPEMHSRVTLILVFAALGISAGGVAAAIGRFWLGCALTGFTLTTTAIVVSSHIPDLRSAQNGGSMAHIVAQRETRGDLVVVSSKFVQDYTVLLELEHRVGYLGHTHELGMGHHVECTPPSAGLPLTPYHVGGESTPQNRWLFTEQRLADEWRGERRIWLICTQPLVNKLTALGVALQPIASDGPVLLFSNRP